MAIIREGRSPSRSASFKQSLGECIDRVRRPAL